MGHIGAPLSLRVRRGRVSYPCPAPPEVYITSRAGAPPSAAAYRIKLPRYSGNPKRFTVPNVPSGPAISFMLLAANSLCTVHNQTSQCTRSYPGALAISQVYW